MHSVGMLRVHTAFQDELDGIDLRPIVFRASAKASALFGYRHFHYGGGAAYADGGEEEEVDQLSHCRGLVSLSCRKTDTLKRCALWISLRRVDFIAMPARHRKRNVRNGCEQYITISSNHSNTAYYHRVGNHACTE